MSSYKLTPSEYSDYFTIVKLTGNSPLLQSAVKYCTSFFFVKIPVIEHFPPSIASFNTGA